MNIEHRTLNVQHRIMYSANFKKDRATRGASACAARANLLIEIMLFAYFKIDKAQRHQYSTFDVRRSTFKAYSPPGGFFVPARRSFIREPPLALKAASLIIKKQCHFGVFHISNLATRLPDTRNLFQPTAASQGPFFSEPSLRNSIVPSRLN